MKTFRLVFFMSLVSLFLLVATAKDESEFKLYSHGFGPGEKLPTAKRKLVPKSITLARLVKALGPGWVGPAESAGIVKWYFSNDTLNVWPSTYGPEEVVSFKGKGGRSRMWWDSSRIKKDDQKAAQVSHSKRP